MKRLNPGPAIPGFVTANGVYCTAPPAAGA